MSNKILGGDLMKSPSKDDDDFLGIDILKDVDFTLSDEEFAKQIKEILDSHGLSLSPIMDAGFYYCPYIPSWS